MKKIFICLLICCLFQQVKAQNVGVNTTTPEAALDINGDIIIRPAELTVDDGITLALDVNTIRFSYYRVTGPIADFTIAGITAGIDGRLVTLFNRSGFAMQLNNEDINVAATDMIVTGTALDITIPNKGIVNLQYDGIEQKWIVKSSSKGGGVLTGGYWETDGTNIFNNNTGNVGIGTNNPTSILSLQTPLNTAGFTHIGGANEIIFSEGVGGVSAAIGTVTNHALRLNAGGTGRVSIYPGGEVVVGGNAAGAYVNTKLTVETLDNAYGMVQVTNTGNAIGSFVGGTSAGFGTYSNTNMRIFCNNVSAMFIAAATGNVGIGTNNPDVYRLAVNGSIRAKEIRVNTGWADYVFERNYKLRALPDLEKFIRINKRLPGIPAASQLKKEGVDISAMQTKMMAKIEELTLYLIEANKTIEQLKQRIEAIERSKQ